MVHFFWLIIQKLSRRREFFRRYHQRRQVSQKNYKVKFPVKIGKWRPNKIIGRAFKRFELMQVKLKALVGESGSNCGAKQSARPLAERLGEKKV